MERKPTDDQILAAVGAWNNSAVSYVIANRLRAKGFPIRTDWVLRQMKRLEREGRVERAASAYATMINWKLAHPA